jgi:hypothetical protein
MAVRLWASSYERFLFGFDVSLSDEGAVSLVQALVNQHTTQRRPRDA